MMIHVNSDISMSNEQYPILMDEVTDPAELAAARERRAYFDRNAAWLQSHAAEVYPNNRGKFICIAGEELFVADTPEQVFAIATTAHPDDQGPFVHYIPKEKIPRIYAHPWRMV
jgi:hypothetical protein